MSEKVNLYWDFAGAAFFWGGCIWNTKVTWWSSLGQREYSWEWLNQEFIIPISIQAVSILHESGISIQAVSTS